MKFLLFPFIAVVLLSADAIPLKRLLTASTNDLGATLVRVPRNPYDDRSWRRFMRGCRNEYRPRYVPTSTTGFLPSTESPLSSDAPAATGPPAGTGSCVPCSMDNFEFVNKYRASNGLRKLRWSDHLAGLAEQWSKEMYDTSVLKHSDFNHWENIIWGHNIYNWESVAHGFFDGWKSSPGHDQNMRLPSHQCMGVGIYGDGVTFYGTQLFSDNCP